MQRQRIALAPEEAESPPDWWPRIFRSRQRRLRARVQDQLALAELTPAGGLTSAELRSRISGFEAEEVDLAIVRLVADGLIVGDVRVARNGRGSQHLFYWRLTREGEADGR